MDTKVDITEWLQQWAGNEKLYPKWSQLPQLMPSYMHARKVAGNVVGLTANECMPIKAEVHQASRARYALPEQQVQLWI